MIADSSVIYGTVHTRKSFFFFLTYCPLKERIILCVRRRRKPFFFLFSYCTFGLESKTVTAEHQKPCVAEILFIARKTKQEGIFVVPLHLFFFFFFLSRSFGTFPLHYYHVDGKLTNNPGNLFFFFYILHEA